MYWTRSTCRQCLLNRYWRGQEIVENNLFKVCKFRLVAYVQNISIRIYLHRICVEICSSNRDIVYVGEYVSTLRDMCQYPQTSALADTSSCTLSTKHADSCRPSCSSPLLPRPLRCFIWFARAFRRLHLSHRSLASSFSQYLRQFYSQSRLRFSSLLKGSRRRVATTTTTEPTSHTTQLRLHASLLLRSLPAADPLLPAERTSALLLRFPLPTQYPLLLSRSYQRPSLQKRINLLLQDEIRIFLNFSLASSII